MIQGSKENIVSLRIQVSDSSEVFSRIVSRKDAITTSIFVGYLIKHVFHFLNRKSNQITMFGISMSEEDFEMSFFGKLVIAASVFFVFAKLLSAERF